ncbi:nicastrin [Stegostoma tigrinum]|uniref:nicastrin n=1 Tax=Stegostoma tigrinum TaxID=3053191 RepID=UPI002870AAF8|nr:nicastrin [Stegostoma tigrinum]
MMRLKVKGRVAGVAVVIPNKPEAAQFSPHLKCPNTGSGVYSQDYGPEFVNCNKTLWNPDGNELSYEDFPFPVFLLRDDSETQVIRKCFLEHNVRVNGTGPDYPLCAMQLAAHMHAVTDSVTCMRRNMAQVTISINPEVVCDPLSDYNVWGVLQPINKSQTVPADRQFVLAASRLDARSFFWGVAPGADSTVSGFIALLSAAQALSQVSDVRTLRKNIMFLFFQGETFDYIGSSKVVYDMKKGNFPIQLGNIGSFLELNQVGQGHSIWAHTDPVSRQNASTEEGVQNLLKSVFNATSGTNITLQEPGHSQPLPPSSFQRFLRERSIPGAVLTDHQAAFTNRYYESAYDTAGNIGLQYPENLTAEESLTYETDTARALADVGTMLARALYLEAGGSEHLDNIKADPVMVSRMLYTFLIQPNNSWSRAIRSVIEKRTLDEEQMMFYVSAASQLNLPTQFVQHILANLTGQATNLTREECSNADKRPKQDRDLYDFLWIRGGLRENATEPEAYCLRSPVWLVKAISPAFELNDWASTEYSTWTESRWKGINARIFLVASKKLEIITLLTGIAVLLVSLILVYFINAKANVLFTTSREHSDATY